jgi:hypothetical protein
MTLEGKKDIIHVSSQCERIRNQSSLQYSHLSAA